MSTTLVIYQEAGDALGVIPSLVTRTIYAKIRALITYVYDKLEGILTHQFTKYGFRVIFEPRIRYTINNPTTPWQD